MANWTNDLQPFGPNHAPLLAGLSSDQTVAVPVAVDGPTGSLFTAGYGYSGTGYQAIRVPTIFKTIQATASGLTTLWTPASNKKFRIMGYDVQLTSNSIQSVAGVITLSLYDGNTPLAFQHDFYVPQAAGQANFAFDSGWHNLMNGFLSSAANNVLSVNLSAALTAGNARVVVMGMEE